MSRAIAKLLMCLGLAIAAASYFIVFPVLEHLLGIETIVGRANVVYLDDGSYVFTNPGAMMTWNVAVALAGLVVFASGVLLLMYVRSQERLSKPS